MPTAETSVTVICENPFHKGPDEGPRFSYDPGRSAAAAVVSREEARRLTAEHEGYRCPALEAPSSEEAALTDISGIGPKTAEALVAAGIETVKALAERDRDDKSVEALADEVDGASADDIIDWQEQAHDLLAA